jgi:hypothetical protein
LDVTLLGLKPIVQPIAQCYTAEYWQQMNSQDQGEMQNDKRMHLGIMYPKLIYF